MPRERIEKPGGSGRVLYVDRLRGLAVLGMFFVHSGYAWLAPAARDGAYGRAVSQISGMVAPVFLFLAGLSMAIAALRAGEKGRDERAVRRSISLRGLKILALGYAFHVALWALRGGSGDWTRILKVDILHCIGAAMAILPWIAWPGRRLGRAALVATLVLVLGAQVTWRLPIAEYLPDFIAGYLTYYVKAGYIGFPLFPYAAWMSLGLCLGGPWWESRENPAHERRFWIRILAAAALLWAAGFAVRWVYYEHGMQLLFTDTPPRTTVHYFMFKAAALLALLFLARASAALIDRISVNLMVLLGRTSLFAYCVHLALVYHAFGPALPRDLGPAGHALGAAALSVVTFALCWVWMRRPKTRWLTLAIAATLALAPETADAEPWPTEPWPDWAEPMRDPDALVSGETVRHQEEMASSGAYHALLYDTDVRIEADGSDREASREILVVHNERGLDLVGDLSVRYCPSEEAFFLVHLRRRSGPGGEWHPLPYRVQLEHEGRASGMYVDERTVAFVPEGIGSGDQIDFAYVRVRGARPGAWDWLETDAYAVHVCHRRLVVDAPLDEALAHREVGFDSPAIEVRGDRRRWAWTFEHVDPAVAEEWLPDDHDPLRRVLISTAGSWEEIGRSYARRLERIPFDEGVARLARRIAAGADDPVREIAAWVQSSIRYVAIEVSAHRMMPEAPAETVARGYGDCKDMSQLLVHMLRAAGEEAWPALVSTPRSGPIDPSVPMISVFDHEIVAVERDSGTLFVDPTIKEAVPPWSGAARPGQLALIADGESGLEPVGLQSDSVDVVEVEVEARRGECGDGTRGCLHMDVVTRYSGPVLAEMRRRFLSGTPDQLRMEAADYFKRATGERTLVDAAHDYSGAAGAASPLEIRERFAFGRTEAAGGCLVRYLPPEIEEWFMHPSVVGRRSPLGLDHPRRTRVDLVYLGPEAEDLALPEEWVHDDGFVRLTRRSSRTRGGVKVSWTAETLRDRVPVESLASYAARMDRDAVRVEAWLCVDGGDEAARRGSTGAGSAALLAGLVSGAVCLALGLVVGALVARRRLIPPRGRASGPGRRGRAPGG